MKAVLVAILLIAPIPSLSRPVGRTSICPALRQVIAAAGETPAFVSLRNPDGYSARVVIGRSCTAGSSYVCQMTSGDVDWMPAEIERCLAGRIRPLPRPTHLAPNPSERRYLIDRVTMIRVGRYATQDIVGRSRNYALLVVGGHDPDDVSY